MRPLIATLLRHFLPVCLALHCAVAAPDALGTPVITEFMAVNDSGPAGGLHTGFSLSADGEYLALVAPDGVRVLSAFGPVYPPQFDNESFGLAPAGSPPAWTYFRSPTPGAPNGVGVPAGPIVQVLDPHPPQPVPGPLTVAVRVLPIHNPVADVRLFHRRMHATESALPMSDDGTGGDDALEISRHRRRGDPDPGTGLPGRARFGSVLRHRRPG